MIKNSIPLSKKMGLVTEPIIALKRIVKVKPQEETIIDFILSVGENKEKVKKNLEKYQVILNKIIGLIYKKEGEDDDSI